MPGVAAMLATDDPNFTVMACTQDFARVAKRSPRELIGKPLVKIFPLNPNIPLKSQGMLRNSFRRVLKSGTEDRMPLQRYDIEINDGKFEERYWRIFNRPFLTDDGKIAGILHAAEDITFEVLNDKRERRIRGFEQAFDLFMDAPQAICIVSGPELVIGLANRTLLKLLCVDAGIVGKPLREALPDAQSGAMSEILNHVLETGQSFEDTQMPVTLPCNGNPRHYFHVTCQPFFEFGKKEASGVLAYGHDVTDKVNAIQQLREKQQRYRMLIEEAPIATAVYYGPDFEIRYINEIMLHYWQKDQSIQGLPFSKALPELTDSTYLLQMQQTYRTGRAFEGFGIEATLVREGRPHTAYYNYMFKALRDENGEIYGIHHTAIDVTKQVLNQQKLEKSEREFRELSQSLEEKVYERTFLISQLNETFRHAERTGKFGSYRYNLRTGELSYSDNLYRIFGTEIGAFQPSLENFMDLVHPDDRPAVQQDAKRQFLQGNPWEHEYRLVRKDGQTIWVRGSTDKIVASDRNEYLIGTLQDITQEKMRERQLTENNAKLVEMNRELESFAYISSHDLQEPLRKIQTFASRIIEEEQSALSERAAGYFERIMNAAHRMQILIDDLLAYSRTNVEDRNFERVDLSDLIGEISEELSEDLQVYQAMIETGKLGQVTIIPFQFRQLLHNLIGNALKFSRPEKLPHIYITSESGTGSSLGVSQLDPAARYSHIRFSDNGIGFPPEFADKIFEVFQRLHTREKYSGTGIGLSIVRKIVENHDGFITATGEPNKGATFDIYIPEREI